MKLDTTTTPKKRRDPSTIGKAERRDRVLARLRAGWTNEAIAREEGISDERVRQIVARILSGRKVDEGAQHALLQMARLTLALEAAAEAVGRGEVKAIGPLTKVLDRFDRYQALAREYRDDDEGIRQKLIDKLNRAAANLAAAASADEGFEPRPHEGRAAASDELQISAWFPARP